MTPENLSRLRFFSLLLLLPGLAGILMAATVSTHYMNTLPRSPDPESQHMIPRNINGYIVYQTEAEDRRLDLIEYSSVAVFCIGLGSGLVYLRKWGLTQALEAEEDEFHAEEA